jgi:predicted membrane channel-forming protein YqfA (hemolysin III family)
MTKRLFSYDFQLADKLIFLFFFVGAILCLGLSSLFHTVCCHSEWVAKLFWSVPYLSIHFGKDPDPPDPALFVSGFKMLPNK